MSCSPSPPRAHPRPTRRCTRWLSVTRAALARVWRTVIRRRRRVPVAVLVDDPVERRRLERAVRREVARLGRLLGPFPDGTVVLVQRRLGGERALAGCYQLSRAADGARHTRIQLALQVGPRQLSVDEVLGVLAEAAIALADERSGAAATRVPLTLPADPRASAEPPRRLVPLDPLRPLASSSEPAAWDRHA